MAPRGSGGVVKVTIDIDSRGEIASVDPDSFRVSKGKHEQVLWQVSDANAQFNVNFEEVSPFDNTQFSDVEPYSGLVRRDVLADPGKYYKYSVTVTTMKKSGPFTSKALDPGGVVDQLSS